jgi:Holliday junction resolvase RusA-like endonuclease
MVQWLLFSCEVPNPPSVNNLFVNAPGGRGRFPSVRYKRWKKAASAHLQLSGEGAREIAQPVEVLFRIGSKSRADLDNHSKALLDLLVETRHLSDDNRKVVKRITLEWITGDMTLVEIYQHAPD